MLAPTGLPLPSAALLTLNLQELFAELIKGSLATFLNAFTYPDRTVFPAASTNLQAGGAHRAGRFGGR